MKKFLKNVVLPSIIIFIIGFLIHSLYNMLPNIITSILFPVNESVWEHMKMIFSSYMIYLIIKNLFTNDKESIFLNSVTPIINIIIFLIIFLPIYSFTGEILFVTLTIYFISIVLSIIIKNKLARKIKITKKIDYLSIFIILFVYLLFAYLTYYPINMELFRDPVSNTYGMEGLD